MDAVHIPVLLDEVIENLITDKTEIFVDATIGGAGHSFYILEKYKNIRLIGIDMDEMALRVAEERLSKFKDRVMLIRGNFKELKEVLVLNGIYNVDGEKGVLAFMTMCFSI